MIEKIKNYFLKFGVSLSTKEVWLIIFLLVSLVIFFISFINNADLGGSKSTLKPNI